MNSFPYSFGIGGSEKSLRRHLRPGYLAPALLAMLTPVVFGAEPVSLTQASPAGDGGACACNDCDAASEEPPGAGTLLGDYRGFRSRLADRGWSFTLDYTAEALGNVSGGLDEGAVAAGLLGLGIDFDAGPALGWDGTTFHGCLLYPHGDSLTEKYVGDLFTLSNIDAPDSWMLFELWAEQSLADGRITLRGGQMAADQEFATTDYGCLFINGTCGWPGLMALNVPAPVYPYGALGLRLDLQMTSWLRLRTALFDGDPNAEAPDGSRDNLHGIEYRLGDGGLWISEFEATWARLGSRDLPGVAKLGTWYHSGDFESVRYDDTGASLADPAGSGQPAELETNWGVYLILQQQVTAEAEDGAQGLGVFTRLATAPSDRNLATGYVEGGLHYLGLLPGRDQDEWGVACAYGRMSDDLRDLGRDQIAWSGVDEPLPDYELIVETEYRVALRDGWTLQPGIHFVFHPGGSAAIDDAVVLSLRTTLSF